MIELIYVGEYIINFLSEIDFKHVANRIRLFSVIDDIPLKVIDEDVKNTENEIHILRLAFLQLLCLESFYEEQKVMRKDPIL